MLKCRGPDAEVLLRGVGTTPGARAVLTCAWSFDCLEDSGRISLAFLKMKHFKNFLSDFLFYTSDETGIAYHKIHPF